LDQLVLYILGIQETFPAQLRDGIAEPVLSCLDACHPDSVFFYLGMNPNDLSGF